MFMRVNWSAPSGCAQHRGSIERRSAFQQVLVRIRIAASSGAVEASIPARLLSGRVRLADMDRSVEQLLACLKGIATGDAIGKQTETLSREDVLRWYPDGVHGFEGSPGTPIPRYVGNRKREWRIGETTDDTERTVAVARAIRQDGDVRHSSVGRELLTCIKCVHPGLRSLWEFHQAGDPARVTDRHDGCGAAVRVAPVGILYRSDRLEQIVAAAREASVQRTEVRWRSRLQRLPPQPSPPLSTEHHRSRSSRSHNVQQFWPNATGQVRPRPLSRRPFRHLPRPAPME